MHERYRTPTNTPSCEQSPFPNVIVESFRKSWKVPKQIFAKRLPLRMVNETPCSRRKKPSRHCNITLTLLFTCLAASLRMRCPTVWAQSKVNASIRSCKSLLITPLRLVAPGLLCSYLFLFCGSQNQYSVLTLRTSVTFK